jgi:SAM-dependent methyltransferase
MRPEPNVSRGSKRFTPAELAAIRRSRRHPRPTQADYLHLRSLLESLRKAIAAIPGPVDDLLDVWCGSRPYDDLFPASARRVGLDVEGNPYGVADVVSNVVLPFDDESFDVLVCIESFQFVAEPRRAVEEFSRVLRPGGTAIVTVPLVFEYDPGFPESRYTEHELRALFEGWEAIDVQETAGRTVAWTMLTGSLLFGVEQHVAARKLRVLHPLFVSGYAALNLAGLGLSALEDRLARGRVKLPMGLIVTARRPRVARKQTSSPSN